LDAEEQVDYIMNNMPDLEFLNGLPFEQEDEEEESQDIGRGVVQEEEEEEDEN
jgi:hypothetical protein